jgi:hypothetical protein
MGLPYFRLPLPRHPSLPKSQLAMCMSSSLFSDLVSYSLQSSPHLLSQLRDLVICPHERGVVNYVQGNSILEQGLFRSGSKRAIANLPFTPNTLSALRLPDSTTTLFAAGGQDAELHLSLHSSSSSSPTSSSPLHHRSSRPHWQHQIQLQGSINNSVMLTSLSLTKANVSSAEPRVAVSNNDCTVKFFEANIRSSDTSPAASKLGHWSPTDRRPCQPL